MRLIRVNNLLLLCILQYLTKYFIIEEFVMSSTLPPIKFLYLVLSTVLIAAAGYIINDLYDINIDQLNNKRNVIANGLVSIQTAWILYIILNTIGLYLGFFLAFTINQPWLSLIFLYAIISLWLYSKSMKKAFLVGNIQVSILAALSIINVALFDLLPILNKANINHTINNNIIYNLQISFIIILAYGIFSFLLTLIREIIKDIEDVKGDQKQGAETLIVKLGYKKTKWVILSLCFIVLLLILSFQYLQYSLISTKFILNHEGEKYNNIEFWGANIESIIYTLIIEIILIIFMYKILSSSHKKKQFGFLSNLAKIIMLLGILSIPIFSSLN